MFFVSAGKYNKSADMIGTDSILKNILFGAYASNVSKSSNYSQKALCNGVYSNDNNTNRSTDAQLAQGVGSRGAGLFGSYSSVFRVWT